MPDCFSIQTLGVPRRAKATLEVVNGFIVGIVIVDPGFGYASPPHVNIQSSSGTGAVLTPILTDGAVLSFAIVNPGQGYSATDRISIASPPFLPSVAIHVSKVNVTLTVVQGRRYVLESSNNLVAWASVGEPFLALEESISQEFDLAETGRYFRVQQLP